MKRILSIDGGGIRGVIPALVLAEIEDKTGKPTAENFDLIAGTSTGGILALGFSKDDGNGRLQYTAKALADIYGKRGKEIFYRSLWRGVSSVGGIADELYSHRRVGRHGQRHQGQHRKPQGRSQETDPDPQGGDRTDPPVSDGRGIGWRAGPIRRQT